MFPEKTAQLGVFLCSLRSPKANLFELKKLISPLPAPTECLPQARRRYQNLPLPRSQRCQPPRPPLLQVCSCRSRQPSKNYYSTPKETFQCHYRKLQFVSVL